MNILKMQADYDNYLAFHLPMKELILKLGKKVPPKKLMHFSQHNLALADVWSDINAKFLPIEGVTVGTTVPDVSVWTFGTLVLSDNAKARLDATLSELGEFLPVMTSFGQFWVFNCLTIVAADEGNSRRVEEQGQVLDVEQLSFRASDVGTNTVFKTDYDGCRSLFCTDTFQQVLRDHDLGGVCFSEELIGAF